MTRVQIIETVKGCQDVMRYLTQFSSLAVDTETVGLEALAHWEFLEQSATAIQKRTAEVDRLNNLYLHSKRDKELKTLRDSEQKALRQDVAYDKRVLGYAKKNPGALDFWRNQLASVQLGVDAEETDGEPEVFMIRPNVIDGGVLNELLNTRRLIILQNATFDWKQLKQHLNVSLHCENLYDTKRAEWLINLGKELSSSLKDIVRRRFGVAMDKTIALSNWAGKWSEEMVFYAAEDVAHLHRIRRAQAPEISFYKLRSTLEMECRLVPSVCRMEMHGVCLDSDELAAQTTHFSDKLITLKADAERVLKGANPASPKQVKLALEAQGMTVKGTDKKALKAYAETDTVQALQEYKAVSKIVSTYYLPLRERAVRYGGTLRIHANFNTASTDTGRLSSSDPNLQNQPAGGALRKVFIPEPGWKFIVGDLSQIEMRILAYVTQDKNLIRAFREDIDVHTVAASMVFGVPYGEVTKSQRGITKAIQFGLVYGKTEYGLSTDLGISKQKAIAFIKRYFRGYRGVERYITATIADAHIHGYVKTLGGRIRHLDGLNSPDKWLREHCERASVNTIIQGTAADGMKRALIYIDELIISNGWEDCVRLVLNVHDEVVVEVRDLGEEFILRVRDAVRDSLVRGTQELIPTVPVRVGNADKGWTCSVVENWAEAK